MKEKGMTLIGMLLTMVCVALIGVVFLRVVPVYIEYYEVTSSINAVSTLLDTTTSSGDITNDIMQFKNKLINQLYLNGIEDVTVDKVSITQNNHGSYNVLIKYQVVKPLVANINLLFDFDINKEVTIGAH